MIAIEFIKRYWQLLAIALLITICYLRIAYIKAERDSARQTIADMQLEAIKKNAEVALLKQQGKRDTEALQASHIKDIQHIGSLYGKVINDDKKSISNYRTALADKLRQQSEDSDKRVSENDANRLAGGDSHGNIVAESEESEGFYRKAYLGAQYYIETLEQAGALCAADYNACKAYVDQEQKRIGVYAE
jgi:hypothetical protein